jgi:hypothetical protein
MNISRRIRTIPRQALAPGKVPCGEFGTCRPLARGEEGYSCSDEEDDSVKTPAMKRMKMLARSSAALEPSPAAEE